MTDCRRLLPALAAVLILALLPHAALAATPADYDASNPAVLENDHLYAESAFLMDMDTGEVLLSKNSRVRMYPASTTKIMTLLLALESDIPLDRVVTIPKEAADIPSGSSVVGIKPGDQMTWEDLLYGFMLKSGNDGSNAIAVLADGSIAAFVERMNARAAELGCEGTHFTNAHGYHDSEHYTTAQDLARIAGYAMQNETFRAIVGAPKKEITITRGGATRTGDAENRNSLLVPDSKYYYAGATGIKTGHHSKAGWCVVASAERLGVRLMAVVLDCATEDRKWNDAQKLFNYGFSQYAAYTMTELLNRMQQELCYVSFENAAEDDPNGGRMLLKYGEIINGDATRMIQRNSDAAMRHAMDGINETLEIEWRRALTAPVASGEVLGTARFTAPDGSPVTAELVASRDMAAKPEPTPTASPTPVPTLAPEAGPDDRADGESDRDGGHVPPAAYLLLAAALILVIVLIAYARAREARRRRLAARRRAARRRAARAAGAAPRRPGGGKNKK